MGENGRAHLASLMDLWTRQPEQPGEYVEKQLPQLILRMRRRRWEQQIKDLNLLQGEALAAGDGEMVLRYKTLISEITNSKLNRLDKAKSALSIMGRRRTEEQYLM